VLFYYIQEQIFDSVNEGSWLFWRLIYMIF